MKLHLPLVLLAALLNTFYVQATEILQNYEQIDLWASDYLEDYVSNTADDRYAFILYTDINFNPTNNASWTSSVPLVTGGNLLFTTADGMSPTSLYIKNGQSGAFYRSKTLTFDTLSKLSFTNIKRDGEGIAVQLGGCGELHINNITDNTNGTNDVVFDSISSDEAAYRGAIGATGADAIVDISQNGSVLFNNNANGGIFIFDETPPETVDSSETEPCLPDCRSVVSTSDIPEMLYAGYISISNNEDVSFSGNKASYTGENGAAIASNVQPIKILSNKDVIFQNNEAAGNGGAIFLRSDLAVNYDHPYENDVTINGNASILFTGNMADGSGGSIYVSAVRSSYDGLIYSGEVIISNNGPVEFLGNCSGSNGGAIYSDGAVYLQSNGDVRFAGNIANARGGAIYTSGNLCIQNNDAVLFNKNVEKSGGTYRLRSIYVRGSGDVVSLSSATGKSIEFRDSVYIGSGATVNLNADYGDIEQKGDIIFTGATTVDDLYEVKSNVVGTGEEISLSRTTEVLAMTNLYGGRLRVEDGAIYQGRGITVHDGSDATVRVKVATLSHSGYNLTFNAGTTLELAGANSITGNVQMQEGSWLAFDGSENKGLTWLTGNMVFHGESNISLSSNTEWSEQNKILLYVDGTLSGWGESGLSISNGASNSTDIKLVNGDLLVLNYNEETFKPYFKEILNITDSQSTGTDYRYYEGITFQNINISSSSDSVCGGAIYGNANSSISVTDNGSVCFVQNMVSGGYECCGGAIYGNEYSTISLNNNGSVEFKGNTTSCAIYSYGGAIYGGTHSRISLSGNGIVIFSENSAPDADLGTGGAICGDTITLSNNISINCSDNMASSFGGAIYGENIKLSENGRVTFCENSAVWGGAIHVNTKLNILDNASVVFNENSASSQGAAINGSNISLSENGSAVFSGNHVDTEEDGAIAESYAWETKCGGAIYGRGDIILKSNDSVEFCSNSVFAESYHTDVMGGAICGGGDSIITLNDNGTVKFKNNKITAEAEVSSRAFGGAICAGYYHTQISAVSISNNDSVEFIGNRSEASTSDSTRKGYVDGAAIYVSGSLSICNNESVLFEKNIAVSSGSYCLNSVYSYYGANVSLSAAADKSIEFRDSVYISSGRTVKLNADYTDADGNTIKQQGDIIFTGKYTETHLNEILAADGQNRTATAEEILKSRTTVVNAMTNLYGGRLRVEDGAIYEGYGITAHEGSAATVRVKDSTLSHSGYDLTFNSGSSLELSGLNNIIANTLNLEDGSSLNVNLTEEHLKTSALTLTGSLSTAGLTISLDLDGKKWGMYRIISLESAANHLTAEAWTAANITIHGSGDAADGTFTDLIWENDSLYYAVGVWNNAEGNRIWSATALNWTGHKEFCNGADVTFSDTGAGEVLLTGNPAPGSITVINSTGNDYTFSAAASGGKLTGETGITKKGTGELTLATANEHTGNTDLREGAINVHHSTALGATSEGLASVTTASDTTLRVDNNSALVLAGSNNSIVGTVEIAAGSSLEMKNGVYAALASEVDGVLAFMGGEVSTMNAGSLHGDGVVRVTDSQVSFASQNSYSGSYEVWGKEANLRIASGNYSGAGQISVSGGTLTFGASADLTLTGGGALTMSELDNSPAALDLRNINIKSGSTLTSYGELEMAVSLSADEMVMGTAPIVLNDTVGGILNCSRLTLNVDSTLHMENAHFDLSGGTLTLAVPKSTTSKIELVLASDAVYADYTQVFLFSNLGTVNFIYDGITAQAGDGTIHNMNAADYFRGTDITAFTELIYDSGQNVLYLQGLGAIPEPTTATLSLLALAALAARRRRK